MLSIFKRAFQNFLDDEVPVRAAALAYYTIFALPPMLVLLLLLAGLWWNPLEVQRAMESQFAGLVGAGGARTLRNMLQSAHDLGGARPLATLLGVGGLLFGATGALQQLQTALNRAWEVTPDPGVGFVRTFLTKRVLSLGIILGVAFLLVVSLAASAFLSMAGERLDGTVSTALLYVLNVVVSFAVTTLLFAALFKILPDAQIEWRDVWMGALVTSLLFSAGKFVIGEYLGRSEPGEVFGAAGALAVILIWVYYAGIIVLFGAEFTQAWAHSRGRVIGPQRGAVKAERNSARLSAIAEIERDRQ